MGPSWTLPTTQMMRQSAGEGEERSELAGPAKPRQSPGGLKSRDTLSNRSPLQQSSASHLLVSDNMANLVSILDHLQVGPPALPIYSVGASLRNTRNDEYHADDIGDIALWQSFNIHHIMQTHGQLLNAVRCHDWAMSTSPVEVVTSETGLRHRFTTYLHSRIKRAVRAAFQHLESTHTLPPAYCVLSFTEGETAETERGFTPDLCFYETDVPLKTSPNRCPGEVKPSYKWSSALRFADDDVEYRQALSQLNCYMKQHSTRYGFMLTDLELVAVRRTTTPGHLELSQSIPWTEQGTVAQPRLTVALGIWYLGMLAADDNGYYLD
ncbi:hypothetical protein ANO11243_093060 [Dothideomycetidae sp. 11243]|nr:hypothetical protein ANO11243_093060 [fungal sp. No.11243]